MTWKDKFLAIDSEVSGLRPDDRMLGFVSCLFMGKKKATDFTQWFNPGARYLDRLPPSVFTANKLTKSAVQAQGPFHEQVHRVKNYLELADVWVSHNMPFEEKHLSFEFTQANVEWSEVIKNIDLFDTRSLHIYLKKDPIAQGHLRNVCTHWHIPGASYGGINKDAELAGLILVKMFPYLPDDLKEMRQFQAEAHQYTKEATRARYRDPTSN